MHREAQRPAARDDRNLVHGIGVRQAACGQSMATLVIGRPFSILVINDPRMLRQAGDDTINGLFKLILRNTLFVFSSSQQRRLIDEIRKVSADKPGGQLRDSSEID